MPIDLDGTQSSRLRLLASAKMLMSRHGYEQASTSAIAREAATSESQLMRYFGGVVGWFHVAWQIKARRNFADRIATPRPQPLIDLRCVDRVSAQAIPRQSE